jgi:hypothetical protein
MIKNKVYRLKQDVEVAKGMSLPSGQEIEIVQNVVYINGNLVPPNFQDLFLNFVINNPNLFQDDTREW